MRIVASEMEREGFTRAAADRRRDHLAAHTAVQLEPAYSGPVVHVVDASRAVGVAGALLDPETRDGFVAARRAEYAERRRIHEERASPTRAADARGGAREPARHRLDGAGRSPPRPTFLGVRDAGRPSRSRSSSSASTGRRSSPTWELPGRYPEILSDPDVGAAARDLFDDAQAMLARVVDERLLRADGVVGFWPAASTPDDDIVLYTDDVADGGARPTSTPCASRWPSRTARPNLALADFTAPVESGVADYVGAFAVTAGHGLDEAQGARSRPRTTTTRRSC